MVRIRTGGNTIRIHPIDKLPKLKDTVSSLLTINNWRAVRPCLLPRRLGFGVRLRAHALVASGRTLNFLAGRTVSSHGRVQERTAHPALQSLRNGNARPRSWRCLVKETAGINAIRRVAILASKPSHAAIDREIRLTEIERHIAVASAVKRIPFARTRHVALGLGASSRHQTYRSQHEPIQHE